MIRRPKDKSAQSTDSPSEPSAGDDVAADEALRVTRSHQDDLPKPQAAKRDAQTGDAAKRDGRRTRRVFADMEARIEYKFSEPALLEQALTHISALTGIRNRAGSYQRLEFLGDHVLGLVVSDMLFRAFPRGDEGELSRRLADLVRKEACAEVARSIDLGAAIRLGASESNAGGRGRTAILADVCEALIGAVFVDGGYAAAAALITRLWEHRMRAPRRPLRDPKTMLQEWAQAQGLPTPAYREVERKGPDHDPEFRVAVALPDHAPAEGIGRSKRSAEQAAASAMLMREGIALEQSDG